MADGGKVCGIVLAGGRSSRMGQDKALLACGGRSLLELVVGRAAPQVDGLLLNANGPAETHRHFGLPLVADSLEGFAGPLAGVLSGMEWLRANAPETEWLASFAVDSPLLPLDLVARLRAAVREQGADIACAASGGRSHPVFALWPCRLIDDLRSALVDEGLRKVGQWMGRYRVVRVEWPGGAADPFFNVNTPEDLAELNLRMRTSVPSSGQ